MTFPTVNTPSTGDCAANTTRTLDMPSGIAAGDLLVAIHAAGQNMSHTWPAGWIEILDTGGTSIAHRVADGSEGASINVTTSGAGRASVYQVHRFSGGNFAAPQVTSVFASNTDPVDPPSLTPSWVLTDVVWCAINTHNNKGGGVSSYPTNYTDNHTEKLSTLESLGGGIQFGTYNLNAASEDPGIYTMSGGGVGSRICTLGVSFVTPGLGFMAMF